MKISTLTAQANGQWQNIIQSLTGTQLQKDKHSPCPVCGGKDRFRFDDLEGRGTYICNQCGAGDGLSLLSKIKGTDIPTAASDLAHYLGVGINARARGEGPQHPSQKESLFLGKLNKAVLGLSDYFRDKGLECPLLMVNGTTLIPLINIDGIVTGIQSISPDGSKKYGAGDKKKNAFYVVVTSQKEKDHLAFTSFLSDHLKTIGAEANTQTDVVTEADEPIIPDIIISEGVATALTTKLLHPKALCIAALDSGNLLPVSQAIRSKSPHGMIIIAADNDAHLKQNVGVNVAQKAVSVIGGCVAIPPGENKADWNDLYLNLLSEGLEPIEAIKRLSD